MFHPLDPYSAYLTYQPCHKNPDGYPIDRARTRIGGSRMTPLSRIF